MSVERFVAKWYRIANKRQWKRLAKRSAPGVVRRLRDEIKFVREHHDSNLLPFGSKAKCYEGYSAAAFECYSDRSDPLGVQVDRLGGRWVVVGIQLYD